MTALEFKEKAIELLEYCMAITKENAIDKIRGMEVE